MSFADHMARADRLMADHTADGEAVYRSKTGTTRVGVPYQLDLDYEVYDENGLAQLIRTIEVLIDDVPEFSRGDVIVTPDREWQLLQVIKDDGAWRRFEVA